MSYKKYLPTNLIIPSQVFFLLIDNLEIYNVAASLKIQHLQLFLFWFILSTLIIL